MLTDLKQMVTLALFTVHSTLFTVDAVISLVSLMSLAELRIEETTPRFRAGILSFFLVGPRKFSVTSFS